MRGKGAVNSSGGVKFQIIGILGWLGGDMGNGFVDGVT